MIGYWHRPVIRLFVTMCILALRLVYRAKSYTSVFLAGMFLFVPPDTCCKMYRLVTKRTTKKNEKTRA